MADQLAAAHGSPTREKETHARAMQMQCLHGPAPQRRRRRKRSTAARRRTTHATSQLQGARRQRRNQSLPHRSSSSSSSRLRADYSFPLFLACTDSAMHAWSVPHRFADCHAWSSITNWRTTVTSQLKPAVSLRSTACAWTSVSAPSLLSLSIYQHHPSADD